MAPVGGWLAAAGRDGSRGCSEPRSAHGSGAFDALYACQGLEFDRAHGLRSIPVRFGMRAWLALSRVMLGIAVACLVALALVVPLGATYLVGVTAVAGLLAYEQSLVSAEDPSLRSVRSI